MKGEEYMKEKQLRKDEEFMKDTEQRKYKDYYMFNSEKLNKLIQMVDNLGKRIETIQNVLGVEVSKYIYQILIIFQMLASLMIIHDF